ncbi:hypothetical protein L596_030762 [Steinernema carpocapsae]|uniref:Citramalyl-CoA lyase, mitochondrial n=1 Tax=Steinernema carpocapsae TaxID=34508 RepID=A0A4U5LNP7_STECR|nr:hypothetical protein L596_030762 [Steinernema carpocapsae]
MFKISRTLCNKLVQDAVAQMVKKGKGYIPRRAILFVPGSSEKMLAKAASLHADSVVLELEDGVAMTAKDEARKNIAKYLENFDASVHKCQELSIRVNSVSSDLIFDDVKEIAKANRLPQAFMVPKVDSVEDLAAIWEAFRSAYGNERITNTQTRLIIFIETARALLDMPRIVNAAVNLHRSSGFFKLDAVVFGYDDYCADIGATRSLELSESVYARQRFVAVCKAFNLQAIDCVFTDIKNLDALKEQASQGRNWGFNGKQLIHPSQVDVTHAAFLPPPERIQWAEELIAAFMEHEKSGKGAFIFHGHMIDRPVLLQAMNIVQTVEKVGKP